VIGGSHPSEIAKPIITDFALELIPSSPPLTTPFNPFDPSHDNHALRFSPNRRQLQLESAEDLGF
ncbi:hypothetical protein C5167_028056, partial [Papaver somniferum]